MSRYVPFIYAPDVSDPDAGPMVATDDKGLPSMGYQSTLHSYDEPLLVDAKGNAIAAPKRQIGFGR